MRLFTALGMGLLMNGAGTESASGAQPPTQTPAPATPTATTEEPAWLPDRLAQKEKSLLKDLGVANIDEAKAAVKAAKEAELAKKSLEERYSTVNTDLVQLQQQHKEQGEIIKMRAEAEFSSLTPEQQKAVTDIAGDNHAKRLQTITALSPTWKKPESAPKVETKAEKKPVGEAKPTSNDGTKTAPGSDGEVDHLAVYESWQSKNPLRAAAYLELHYDAIEKARESRSA